METFTFDQSQNLKKIGPVYSAKDEKQRVIVEQIQDFKIRPKVVVNINKNIPGLDKKKVIGSRNPATFRFFHPFSHISKRGYNFIMTAPNAQRFMVPGFVFLFYYYVLAQYINGTYIKMELHNEELEYIYPKMGLTAGHFIEKFSLMA